MENGRKNNDGKISSSSGARTRNSSIKLYITGRVLIQLSYFLSKDITVHLQQPYTLLYILSQFGLLISLESVGYQLN